MNRDQLLLAVNIMTTCTAERSQEAPAFQAAGFSDRDARILIDALPEAFAIPVVEELGVAVDELGSAKNAAGQWVKVSLAASPIFAAALDLARAHRATVAMPQPAYEAIARRSSMLVAISKALNEGADVKGATVAVALIGTKAEDFEGAR